MLSLPSLLQVYATLRTFTKVQGSPHPSSHLVPVFVLAFSVENVGIGAMCTRSNLNIAVDWVT